MGISASSLSLWSPQMHDLQFSNLQQWLLWGRLSWPELTNGCLNLWMLNSVLKESMWGTAFSREWNGSHLTSEWLTAGCYFYNPHCIRPALMMGKGGIGNATGNTLQPAVPLGRALEPWLWAQWPQQRPAGSLALTVVLWLSGRCLWRSHFHRPQILRHTNLLSKAPVRILPHPARISGPQLKSNASSGKFPFINKHSRCQTPQSIQALGSCCHRSSFFCCSPGIGHHKAPPKQHQQHPWPAPWAVPPSADSICISPAAPRAQRPTNTRTTWHTLPGKRLYWT